MAKTVAICRLFGKQLRVPLVAVVESADSGCIAHASDISVFGYGRDDADAVEVLKQGIEGICLGEEFLDLRATIHGMVLPENLITAQESEPQGSAVHGGGA